MVAYCTKDDLLIGDIPLAGKYGDGSAFVQLAADEIDAQVGGIYVTPVVVSEPTSPENRPTLLTLKKINQLLASGRLILDMAAGGEDRDLHAYGKRMVDEALGLLSAIVDGKMLLRGVERIAVGGTAVENTHVSVSQVDSGSLVEDFYTRYRPPFTWPGMPVGPSPYDVERDVS